MINLLGQTTLPTLRKLFRAVLEFSIELDTILTKEHLNSYFSIVYSHLQYAIGAWGGVGKTSLRRLNVLHNKIMSYTSFRSKLDPLYKYLNLLKVDDIYKLEIGKIMHE